MKRTLLLLVLVACGDKTPVAPMDAAPTIDAPPPEPAMLRIDLPMVEFGSVALGTPSPPTLVTITNAGDQATGALTVALVGDGAASFSASGSTCGQALSAGASCTIVVTFTPQVIAGLHAKLTVHGSPGGSVAAMLDGVGLGVGQGLLAIESDANMLGSEIVGQFGTTATTFTITNKGGTPTGQLAIQQAGANPDDFVVEDQCSTLALAPGDSCIVRGRFAPKARGERSGVVEIFGSPGGTVIGAMTGVGLAPAKLVTTYVHRDLGTVASGATTTSTLTFTNTGDVATSSIDSGFDNASGFSFAGGTCANASVMPGASCTVVVGFSSTVVGAHDSQVMLAATPQGGAVNVTLGADVVAAGALTISPTSVDLGKANLGAMGTAQVFTVTNHGAASTGALATTATDPSFAISANTCAGADLAPNASCTLTATFQPTAATPRLGRIDVVAASSVARAAVTGVGLGPANLVLSTSTQGFGTAVAADGFAAATFVLANTGGQASGVPAIAIGGVDATDFTTVSDCTVALAPGASCTIITRFAPAATGVKSATLTASASPGGAPTSTLTGNGVLEGFLISPAVRGFDPTPTDASSTETFVVRNTTGSAMTDLAIATTDPVFAPVTITGTNCGTSLAAGASCYVGVTFTPTTAATSRGSLVITGGGRTASAALTGTGQPLAEVLAVDDAPTSSTTIAFGAQTVGGDPPLDAYVTFVVHSARITFMAYDEQYGVPAQFATMPADCGGAPGGAPCTLRLRFAPTATGPASGTLTLKLAEYLDSTGKKLDFPLTLTGTGAP